MMARSLIGVSTSVSQALRAPEVVVGINVDDERVDVLSAVIRNRTDEGARIVIAEGDSDLGSVL